MRVLYNGTVHTVYVHVHVCVVFGGSDRDYWLHSNYKPVHLQIVYMCMYVDVI